MPKARDAHLIQIKLHGRRAKISQPDYELSPDEWHRRRTEAFAQLRKFGGTPKELLQLVEEFRERDLVALFVFRAKNEVALRFGVKVLPIKRDKAKRLAEMIATRKRLNSEPDRKGMSASEALAFFLRMDLRGLKHEERERSRGPSSNFESRSEKSDRGNCYGSTG
jgi:hypothetical protein